MRRSFAVASSLLVGCLLAGPRFARGADELLKPDADKSDAQRPEAGAKPAAAAAEIVVDTSDAPEMEAYGRKVKELAEKWYPIIAEKLPSDGFEPPRKVIITFRKDYDGVAAASGNRIVCAVKWFTERPEDLGAVVHELVHVVQNYRRGDRPGWLVEGIADYVRFFHYEPADQRPRPDPRRAKHTDSYRTSAAFLDWAQRTYDKDLVVKLNTACRQAKYNEGLWKEYTGKTLDELGAEWKESLRKR